MNEVPLPWNHGVLIPYSEGDIPEHLDAIKVQTWTIDIRKMLHRIPEELKDNYRILACQH